MRIDAPVTVASRNPGKVAELQELARGALRLRHLPDVPEPPAVTEDGATYLENALRKARVISHFVGGPALADDSGLEVDALGGRPGLHSARYGGPGLDDRARVARLLAELGDASMRSARFRAVLVLADGACWRSAEGVLEGRIAAAPRGDAGFGYDPVFVASDLGDRTLAEVPSAAKNRISHRARALHALLASLGRLPRPLAR